MCGNSFAESRLFVKNSVLPVTFRPWSNIDDVKLWKNATVGRGVALVVILLSCWYPHDNSTVSFISLTDFCVADREWMNELLADFLQRTESNVSSVDAQNEGFRLHVNHFSRRQDLSCQTADSWRDSCQIQRRPMKVTFICADLTSSLGSEFFSSKSAGMTKWMNTRRQHQQPLAPVTVLACFFTNDPTAKQ